QHLGCFAEAEIAAPAPHIGGQLFHCRLDANTLGPARDLPDSPLEPFQRFWRDRALDVRTSREAEPEELPFLRSCHRTLRLVYLELELLCDEARDALHHPLTRAFAANIDVTVVRITNEAVFPVLQLAVEFVEPEITEQWRKRSSLRSSFHARADQSVLHHPGIQECPDELQQPLVLDPFGNLAHQFVMIDSIEEFFQIEVDHPSVALRNVLLRLSHGVMRRPTRSEPLAILGERRIPSPLQNLHHRLLDKSGPARLGRQAFAPLRHPASGFPPVSPVSVRRSRSAIAPDWTASAASGSCRVYRPSSGRRPRSPCCFSLAAMLPSSLLVHIFPPRFDSCWLGVRAHSPPRAIRCLPAPPAGLHPSAPMRSPVSTGYSAACRFRDSCPTCLSSRSGLQPSFPVRPIC